MALRARKVSRAFEKRAPGPHNWLATHLLVDNYGTVVYMQSKSILTLDKTQQSCP